MVIPAREPRDVQRRLRGDLDPVAGFYIEEPLGLRRRVAKKRDDEGQPALGRNRRVVHANPTVGQRRRPQGSGRGRPEALAGTHLPHHARGGLYTRARVGVVLHLGAERDRQPISEERDLVLQKGGHQ